MQQLLTSSEKEGEDGGVPWSLCHEVLLGAPLTPEIMDIVVNARLFFLRTSEILFHGIFHSKLLTTQVNAALPRFSLTLSQRI